MKEKITTVQINVNDMTCISCERRIGQVLKKAQGVKRVEVSYTKGTARVTYDSAVITKYNIIQIIEDAGYHVDGGVTSKGKVTKQNTILSKVLNIENASKAIKVAIIVIGIYIVARYLGLTRIFYTFPEAREGMSYGMLFIIGLFTSVHCIAMCGGINLSQCIASSGTNEDHKKVSAVRPAFLYNLGRVISYTMLGGIVGGIGSVVSMTNSLQGLVQVLAGIFMIIMGLNMLAIFPWLRRFAPRMPRFIAKKINRGKQNSNPLIVGLLNGLMPCGPLQAMQIYALSTGSLLQGALSMLLFSLGTVPLMFGIGALSSFMSKRFTSQIMRYGAVLVVVLGFSMFNNGLNLSGVVIGVGGGQGQEAEVENGVQTVTTKLTNGIYSPITVEVGTPVRWNIQVDSGQLSGCNYRIYINEYGIEKQLEVGDNYIEFTPTKTGSYPYSCWMGMLRSRINVIDPNEEATKDKVNSSSTKDTVTDEIAVATIEDGVQKVSIQVDATRFNPAIVVLQKDIQTQWDIYVEESTSENELVSFPLYGTEIYLMEGSNPLVLVPTEDFDFYTLNNEYYGYVKVVDDINSVDLDAIKEEVKQIIKNKQS